MRSVIVSFLVIASFVVASPAFAKDIIDHKPFDEVLKTYVSKKGMVDYKGLKANEKDFAKFNTYVEAIGNAKVKGSKKAKLAFYINAYNAHVIKAVIDKLPTKSVMKVDGFFKKTKHNVAGKSMTLDHLENKIIRPKFNDARIHFALVCAAKSCPPLKRKAFTEKNVNKMLEKNTKKFVPKATKVDGNTVTTSQLFNWFADDFKNNEGSVANYLAKYLPEHAELLKSGKAEIKFSHYNWDLNSK